MNRSSGTRIGVIGVGSLGFHHARLLRDIDGARMVGVHDANPDRSHVVAEELGVQAFESQEALLDRVDAAVVAVPTTAHAAVALAALDHGVHLLIEKPLASTLDEADQIIERAEAAGVVLATGHVERFNSVLAECDPFLDAPRFIESHRLAPFNPRGTDVAVVLDLMIHDLDLVLSLAGREPQSISAVGVPVLTPNIDIANARLVFEGGAVANITASRVSRERMRKIRFFQRSGYISLDLGAGTGEFLRIREGAGLGMAEPGQLALEDIVERIELNGDGKEPLRRELEAFLAAVRGDREVVVTGRDGRRALAAALEIVESIEHHVADPHPA